VIINLPGYEQGVGVYRSRIEATRISRPKV
jgi:hypothetical protein